MPESCFHPTFPRWARSAPEKLLLRSSLVNRNADLAADPGRKEPLDSSPQAGVTHEIRASVSAARRAKGSAFPGGGEAVLEALITVTVVAGSRRVRVDAETARLRPTGSTPGAGSTS